EARERLRDDPVQADHAADEVQGTDLDAAHVEQVLDEAREAIGLVLDRLEELRGLLWRPVDVALAEAGDRCLDRREWCAQVVRNRREERGPQGVGLGAGGPPGGPARRAGPAGAG